MQIIKVIYKLKTNDNFTMVLSEYFSFIWITRKDNYFYKYYYLIVFTKFFVCWAKEKRVCLVISQGMRNHFEN